MPEVTKWAARAAAHETQPLLANAVSNLDTPPLNVGPDLHPWTWEEPYVSQPHLS